AGRDVRDKHDRKRLARVIVIDGRRTAPADVTFRNHTLTISVREGRNRQVRNMCDAIGHPIVELKRVAIGPLRDRRLKPGQWRDLTRDEVKTLRAATEHGSTK